MKRKVVTVVPEDFSKSREWVELDRRIAVLERQMERIGAPLYRIKGNLLVQRVRNLPKPDYKLRSEEI